MSLLNIVITTLIMVISMVHASSMLMEQTYPCNASQISCKGRCGIPQSRDMGGYYCNCDYPECNYYGDCCDDFDDTCPIDNDDSNPSVLLEKNTFECIDVAVTHGVFVRSKCRDQANMDSSTINACENANRTEPLFLTPVTDTSNGETYRNLFCAKCNDANSENIIFWKPKIFCESTINRQISEQFQITDISGDSLWELPFTHPNLCQ
ncbi:unnamed protein product, partial [Owenia fusiformis]